jgi:hypothetical protein
VAVALWEDIIDLIVSGSGSSPSEARATRLRRAVSILVLLIGIAVFAAVVVGALTGRLP